MPRIIAHLDMDSFFASIEERDNPRFAHLPIVVGADPKNGLGRGVASTANYLARAYGIHSAQPISTAWRLSQAAVKQGKPAAVFLPVNGPRYAEVSQKIMKILHQYVPSVEQTSIDEAYLDLSESGSFEKAKDLIKKIKDKIKEKEKLTASVGIGPNKLIAKMVSAKFKPDGLTTIMPKGTQTFLDPLPVGEIPGVGPKTEEKLHQRKIFLIRDLRKLKKQELVSLFGKWGEDIYEKAQGIDDEPLELVREVKSISEQETFEKDTLAAVFLLDRLTIIARRVLNRMPSEEVLGFRTITVTVRFADFETKSRSHSLNSFSSDFAILQKEAFKLFLPFLDRRENPRLKPIRLLGVGIENLLHQKEKKQPSKQNQFNFSL